MIGDGFKKKDLEMLARADDFYSFLKNLERYPIFGILQKEIADIDTHKSLVYVFNALEKYLIDESKRFSYLHPVSIIPILDYFLRKKKEIDNTRIIAYGKQEGLKKDLIEQLITV
jgi:V/A-type H+-transporting ATPase subunit C